MKIIAKYAIIGIAAVLRLAVHLDVLFISYYESGEEMELFKTIFFIVCPIVALITMLVRTDIVREWAKSEPEEFMLKVLEVEREEGRNPDNRDSTARIVLRRMFIGNAVSSALVLVLWAVLAVIYVAEATGDVSKEVTLLFLLVTLVALVAAVISLALRLVPLYKNR